MSEQIACEWMHSFRDFDGSWATATCNAPVTHKLTLRDSHPLSVEQGVDGDFDMLVCAAHRESVVDDLEDGAIGVTLINDELIEPAAVKLCPSCNYPPDENHERGQCPAELTRES